MRTRIKTYLQFINEDRDQLNIPFKEREFKGKSVHGHLIDAMERLKVGDANSYRSKSDPEKELEAVKDKVLLMLVDTNNALPGDIEMYIKDFCYKYPPLKNEKGYWKESFIKKHRKEFDKEASDDRYVEMDNMISIVSKYINNLKDAFSERGWKEMIKQIEEEYSEDVDEMKEAVINSFKNDSKGLIDIWRSVSYRKDDERDIFLAITKKYKGVGLYWAWKQKAARNYWGLNAKDPGHHITLHAKASTEAIDWEQTLYKNSYGLKGEKEIKVKENNSVLMVGFFDNHIKKYIKLEEPMLVKTS